MFICFILQVAFLEAQEDKNSVTKNGEMTVTFENEDTGLNPMIQDGLVEIIFQVYPKLVRDFNPDARQELKVKIDTTYNGVAYAHNGEIVISSKWLRQRPEDLDLITHEVMHIIQSYPSHAGPGWLTEGIADYVRHVYGVDNKGAKWSLPNFSPNQKYTDSYRVTARFLLWATQKYDEDLVVKLDRNLRNKTYSAELWKNYTGKTLDELWDLYTNNPTIS